MKKISIKVQFFQKTHIYWKDLGNVKPMNLPCHVLCIVYMSEVALLEADHSRLQSSHHE